MSRITKDTSVDRFADWQTASKYCAELFEQIARLFSNGQSIADNFDAKILTLTFSSSATDTTLVHGLGRVPTGYLVLRRSANMVVYDGTGAWSANSISLKSSAAGNATISVF